MFIRDSPFSLLAVIVDRRYVFNLLRVEKLLLLLAVVDGLKAEMNKIILTYGYKSLSGQCRESTKFDIVPPTSLSSCHLTHHRSYSDCKPCVDGKSGKASAIILS